MAEFNIDLSDYLFDLFNENETDLNFKNINFTNNATTTATSESTLLELLEQVSYGIIGLLGLCGNLILILTVIKFHSSKLKSVTYFYIANVAISDCLCLSGMPFLITYIRTDNWPFGSLVCSAYAVSVQITYVINPMLLIILAIDRYNELLHPTVDPKRRHRFIVAVAISLAVWIGSSLILASNFWNNRISFDYMDVVHCIVAPLSYFDSVIRDICDLGYCISLLLILLLNILLLCRLSPNDDNATDSPIINRGKSDNRQLTVLVVSITSAYFLFSFPIWIIQILTTYADATEAISLRLRIIADCLSFIGSSLNPILCVILSEDCRMCVYKTISCSQQNHVKKGRTETSNQDEELSLMCQ